MNTFLKLLTVMLGISLGMNTLATVNYPTALKANHYNWQYDSIIGKTIELIDMYTDDAIIIPPTSEILTGTTAIKGFWDEILKGGVSEYVIDTINLHIDGNTAHQTAYWQAHLTAANGEIIQFDGTMTNVLERQENGQWKISMQSWN
jgi:ketosteroid isomerase-like protein